MDYHVWNTMLGHYQRHMPKLANVMPRWKTILLTIHNDLLHEFINKKFVSFCNRFRSCVAATAGHCWTVECVKFRLLYLMNYISYFNKICSICCVNTHIQSLKVWLISVYYHGWNTAIFLGDCFLLAHPVHEVTMLLLTTLSCINRNSNNKRCWRICYHFYRHVSSICWVPNSRKSAK